jgi:hypothetical protein
VIPPGRSLPDFAPTGLNEDADILTRLLIDEICDHAKVPRYRWVRRILSPLIRAPLHRFSELVLGFDERVAALGICEAAEWFLPNFARSAAVDCGANVPRSGPVLMASNHPGTCDALVIAAAAARADLRILASRIPFLARLPATCGHLLFTSPDPLQRRDAMWSALRHLETGGAVLMFPSGGIDPDPACMAGADTGLDDRFGTVEVILKRAPDTRLVLAVVGGVLLPAYVHHPLTRLRRGRRDRQRISEYLQVIRQVLARGELRVSPRVSFARPVTLAELNGTAEGAVSGEIARRFRLLLGACAWTTATGAAEREPEGTRPLASR